MFGSRDCADLFDQNIFFPLKKKLLHDTYKNKYKYINAHVY